jgi:dephospho-CoA kinase
VETDSVELCDVVVVIDLDISLQIERLIAHRGMSVEQAEERIRNQSPREVRNLAATWVIDNSGTRQDFERACISVWKEIVDRAHKIIP